MISIFKGTIKFTLEQARKPRGGVTSVQERGGWSMPCRAALPLGKTLYPMYVGWAPGPVWTGAENLIPTGIRSPDRPASSESLYCLHYPSLISNCNRIKIVAISFNLIIQFYQIKIFDMIKNSEYEFQSVNSLLTK